MPRPDEHVRSFAGRPLDERGGCRLHLPLGCGMSTSIGCLTTIAAVVTVVAAVAHLTRRNHHG